MSTTPHSTYRPFRVPIYPLCDAQGVPILSREEAIVQWGNELELDGRVNFVQWGNELELDGRVNSAFTHIKRLLTGLALKSGGFSESSAVAAIHLTAQLIQLHSITVKKETYNERLYTRGCNISAAIPAAIANLAQLDAGAATDMEDQCIGWFTLDSDDPSWPMTGSVPNVKFEWNRVLGDQVLDLTFSALMPNCIMEDITIPIYDSYLVSAEKKAAITFTGLEHIYPGYPGSDVEVDSAWARVHQAAKKEVPQLELQYIIRSPQHVELVNWHFARLTGLHFAQLTGRYEANLLTDPLTSCFKLNLVTPDNTNVDIPIEKCSFNGRGSSKYLWTPISIDLPSSNKGNLLFANSDFVATTLTWQNTAGNGKGQVPSFSSCHFNEAIIDIGTVPYSPVAGVNFVDCFNPKDSGGMSANSNSIAVHMQSGQFINISGSGYRSDPDPIIFRTSMQTGADIQIKRQKHFGIADAAPISVSLRDIPATVPIELSVKGAAQVFMSDILLHKLVVDSTIDNEPQQYTGINVHESGAVFNSIMLQDIRNFKYDNYDKLNLKAPNISLSYTAESGAGATTPVSRHLSVYSMRKYVKDASVWQLAKTAGMLRAGITEANQDQVKTLLEVVDQAVAKQHRQSAAPVKKTKSGTTP